MDDETLCRNCAEEIIRVLSVVLGANIVVLNAQKVHGLEVDNNGVVLEISKDPQVILESLVSVFVEVSGDMVNDVLEPVFNKYPEIIKLKDHNY